MCERTQTSKHIHKDALVCTQPLNPSLSIELSDTVVNC